MKKKMKRRVVLGCGYSSYLPRRIKKEEKDTTASVYKSIRKGKKGKEEKKRLIHNKSNLCTLYNTTALSMIFAAEKYNDNNVAQESTY